DPTRRAILARLARGEAAVGELARPFPISGPAISRHLRVLQHARLIERRVDAQWRQCRLRAKPLHAAADWLDTYRKLWNERLENLARYLDKTAPKNGRRERNKR